MQVRFKREFLRVSVIALLLSISSCQLPGPEVNRALSQIANYEVMAKDLPAGWKAGGQDWGQDYGGQSHLVTYGIDNDDVIRLTHTISIYPDEAQAKAAYPQWEDEWFNKGAWQEWPGADFIPSDPKDEYRFECLDPGFVTMPMLSCLYLQRHKQFISFVLTNFNDQSMTFAQLNAILKAVDDRLNQIEFK